MAQLGWNLIPRTPTLPRKAVRWKGEGNAARYCRIAESFDFIVHLPHVCWVMKFAGSKATRCMTRERKRGEHCVDKTGL